MSATQRTNAAAPSGMIGAAVGTGRASRSCTAPARTAATGDAQRARRRTTASGGCTNAAERGTRRTRSRPARSPATTSRNTPLRVCCSRGRTAGSRRASSVGSACTVATGWSAACGLRLVRSRCRLSHSAAPSSAGRPCRPAFGRPCRPAFGAGRRRRLPVGSVSGGSGRGRVAVTRSRATSPIASAPSRRPSSCRAPAAGTGPSSRHSAAERAEREQLAAVQVGRRGSRAGRRRLLQRVEEHPLEHRQRCTTRSGRCRPPRRPPARSRSTPRVARVEQPGEHQHLADEVVQPRQPDARQAQHERQEREASGTGPSARRTGACRVVR